MPTLKVGLQPTPQGVALSVAQQGAPPATAHLSVDEARVLLFDLWAALGHHYPPEASDPDQPRPRCLEIGDAKLAIDGTTGGFVELWIRPPEFAGIAYNMKPGEAREIGRQLYAAADGVAAFLKPN